MDPSADAYPGVDIRSPEADSQRTMETTTIPRMTRATSTFELDGGLGAVAAGDPVLLLGEVDGQVLCFAGGERLFRATTPRRQRDRPGNRTAPRLSARLWNVRDYSTFKTMGRSVDRRGNPHQGASAGTCPLSEADVSSQSHHPRAGGQALARTQATARRTIAHRASSTR